MIESVLKPPNESDLARFNDLTMLVVAPGGKERTEEEFGKALAGGRLFSDAGDHGNRAHVDHREPARIAPLSSWVPASGDREK